LYQRIKLEKGLGNKEIPLMRCRIVSTSLLTGFTKPIIILPNKQFNTDELEMIFRHELLHYKRGDLFIKLVSAIALSLHWFNPIVYLMCSAIQTECEASCDEAVLQDIGADNKQFYAELIVEMVGMKKTPTMLSTCFYGGKRSLKRRLDSILEYTYKVRKPAYIVLLVIIMMSLMSGSVFAFSFRDVSSEPVPQNDVIDHLSETVDVNKPVYQIDVTDRDTRPENPPITFTRAVEIAKEHVQVGGDGWFDQVSMDFEKGQWVWEVELKFESDLEVEVCIDIITGEVLDVEWD
jgi:uncharacterized membrane protein YkoI